jgi:hypothetical protein
MAVAMAVAGEHLRENLPHLPACYASAYLVCQLQMRVMSLFPIVLDCITIT